MHKENSQRPPVLQHVSQNVRRLRNSADLSQTALAEKSGVSRRMLVAIEAGEKNVSLATLAGTIVGSKAVLLARAVARREVELWEFCLQPGDAYVSEADPDGWSEQVYVVEGHLTLRFADPAAVQQVEAGEFFMFPSNQPHRYCNDADVPLRFVRNVVL
ncbi:XRE family transcriptional regulator [Pseudomonas syringae pv. syringae]|uniref:XRE family transcriptional regulator n=1 Tax=Pseudomonas syringae TaxID=317 RepID=UPI002009E360|nr:XRE family transcriptional regulator [Pseudomonas syringae]MCK9748979.1 XRE family transcriptional regulator [Pseudomonas syringae pv. syringae]